MAGNNNTLVVSNKEVSSLDWKEFHDAITEHLKNQFRLLSFFASPTAQRDLFNLNAVFIKNSNGLKLLRTTVNREHGFHTFSQEHSIFHYFEREIYEQFQIRPKDHPWLKPVRFSGAELGKTSTYPFFRMQGKEIHEVGVGPIHAGVIEPGHFRFMCYGEKIHHLEIQLGYQHRDLESLIIGKHPLKLAPLLETAAGDSSIAHTWAYCLAVETLCNASPDLNTNLVRAIALELERIAMHLAGLAGISTDIAFLPGGSSYGRLRTAIINTSMRICGSRFGRGWLRPGGVRHGLNQKLKGETLAVLEDFNKDFGIISQLFQNSASVKHRLVKTGTISKQLALDLGLVGLAARASDVEVDLRHDLSTSPYNAHPMEIVSEKSGDCFARSLVRIREIEESTQWIISVLKGPHDLQPPILTPQTPRSNLAVMSVVEGWRGEVFHYLETGSDGNISQYRVQDPSLRNWFGVAQSVRGVAISDFPICNKSFDLSYCGHDL